MSKVYKRDETWVIRYRDHLGRDIRRSVPWARSKADALIALDKAKADTQRIKMLGYFGAPAPDLTISKMLDLYLAYALEHRRHNTYTGYRYEAGAIKERLGARLSIEITPHDVESYLAWKMNQPKKVGRTREGG